MTVISHGRSVITVEVSSGKSLKLLESLEKIKKKNTRG